MIQINRGLWSLLGLQAMMEKEAIKFMCTSIKMASVIHSKIFAEKGNLFANAHWENKCIVKCHAKK